MSWIVAAAVVLVSPQPVVIEISTSNQHNLAGDRDDIIVTGERIARTAYETSSSVAISTADDIDRMAEPERVEQIFLTVPNIQIGSGGEGPTIRGQDSTGVLRDLPAFLAGTRPRTTISVDGRALSYYELAFGHTPLWDVARVELFRTPQTTTQGRNSIGGAIFVVTEDPTPDWRGRARMIGGDLDLFQMSGAISGPLVADQLAVRLAGDWRSARSSTLISSDIRNIDPNRFTSSLFRFKLRATPAALERFRADLAYSRTRSQEPQIEGAVPPYRARRTANAIYGIFEVVADALSSRLVYDATDNVELRGTATFGSVDITRHAPRGLGETRISQRDYSFEPVMVWRPDSGKRLSAGLNFGRTTLDQSIDLTSLPTVLGTGNFDDVQHSLGIFAELEVPLAKTVLLAAGLRYQWDRQEREGSLVGAKLVLPVRYRRTFEALLPKLSLAWDVTPNLRIGALVQRASNAGGMNLNNVSAMVELFDAESLWDFELFARSRAFDGKLTISANMFRYEMTDAQRTQDITTRLPDGRLFTSAIVGNAPKSRTQGLEVEVAWHASNRLSIRGGLGLLHTEIVRSPDSQLVGKRFQRAPRVSASAAIAWTPVDGLALSAQARHNSGYYSDDRETLSRHVGSSTTLDAKAALTAGRVTLSAYVRNVFDEFHLTYIFDGGLATPGKPREVGLGLDAQF